MFFDLLDFLSVLVAEQFIFKVMMADDNSNDVDDVSKKIGIAKQQQKNLTMDYNKQPTTKKKCDLKNISWTR